MNENADVIVQLPAELRGVCEEIVDLLGCSISTRLGKEVKEKKPLLRTGRKKNREKEKKLY